MSPDDRSLGPTHPPHDQQRLVALVAGDVAALRSIMADYWEPLSTIALIVTGSPDLARDAVQDTFVQLWDTRATLDPARGVDGYLKTIVRRRAIDLLRRERKHANVGDALAHAITTSRAVSYNAGASAVESEELDAFLRAAIAELPPRCRQIFLLNRQGGLSYADIAATLGITVPTVRNQMAQAAQRLAQAMAQWEAKT